jgi:hypothetical protein
MHLINFRFVTSIEIGVPDHRRILDLHNCFDWQGIAYLSEERLIKMSCKCQSLLLTLLKRVNLCRW